MKTLAIIVNYLSAELTRLAARSVLASATAGPLELVVLDNSEDRREAERLQAWLPQDVTLIVNRHNLGFGRACNLAFESFGGDCLLLLNPDARLLPGCLIRLQRTLSAFRKAGAVGPQIFWDDATSYLLPPSSPALLFFMAPLLSKLHPRHPVKKVLSRLWRRYALRLWRTTRPARVGNLSGGHVLLRTPAVHAAGGLFDERFFLYFEDTDLFVRLRQAGFSLWVDPRAAVVHHYDQCGMQEYERKRLLMEQARRAFLQKYSRCAPLRLATALGRCVPATAARPRSTREARFDSPFNVPIPTTQQSDWLFEWSPNPDFLPAAGCLGRGPELEFGRRLWDLLAPGQYYGRLGATGKLTQGLQEFSWVVEGTGGQNGSR